MKNSERKYELYVKYILEESSTPVDDIEFLIRNLKQDVLEELEETIDCIIPTAWDANDD